MIYYITLLSLLLLIIKITNKLINGGIAMLSNKVISKVNSNVKIYSNGFSDK